MRSGRLPASVVPPSENVPDVVGRSPMSVSHSVDLPIPLRPMIATDSTPIEKETSSSTCDDPYPAQRSLTSNSGSGMAACHAQVDLVDQRVVADLVGRAFGDDEPVGHHNDALGDPQGDVHVVLDEQQCRVDTEVAQQLAQA